MYDFVPMRQPVEDETARATAHGFPVQTVRVVVAGGGGVAEGESVSVGTAQDNRIVLADRAVSRYHLEISATTRGIRVRDLGSTNGTFLGTTRIESAEVRPGTSLRVGDAVLSVEAGAGTQVDLHQRSTFHGLVGSSAPMRRLFSQIDRAAQSSVSVLLSGESGTGKERVADALHRASPRASQALEVVDCGALVPTLVASELFGHERGAFTGAARQHVGAFERAHQGTLLLDEIGELPMSIQPALLGAIERKRIRRLGGNVDIPVDVRIVSATHRDLRAEVNAGRFRLDLFYRIASVVLVVPPLRERMADLPALVEHFARAAGYAGQLDELVSEAALTTLGQGRFDGNLRELRNVVEALLAMGELPAMATAEGATDVSEALLTMPYKQARAALLRDFEERYIGALLERAGGNIAAAARVAGMDRSYLSELVSRIRRQS